MHTVYPMPPSFKLNMTTIAAVLALHGVLLASLAYIESPKMTSPDPTPPIEITMVNLQQTLEPVPMVQTPPLSEPARKPQPEVQPQPTPTAHPKRQPPKPKPEPVRQITPKIEPKVEAGIEEKIKPQPQPKPQLQPDPHIIATQRAQAEQQRQWEIQQQQARAQAEAEARARAQAEADARAKAQAQADARARAAAEKAAAERAAAQQAANSGPVTFSASQASWVRAPNLSFPERARQQGRSGDVFNVSLKLTVDKQGKITQVQLLSSSGNAIIDREAQREVRRARLHPFIRNGVPVVGVVTLPLQYKIP